MCTSFREARRGRPNHVAHPGTAVTGRSAFGMPARASRHAWIGQADSHANPPRSSTDPEWALLHAAGAGLLRSISEAMKGSTTVHPLRATPVPVVLTILWDRDIS